MSSDVGYARGRSLVPLKLSAQRVCPGSLHGLEQADARRFIATPSQKSRDNLLILWASNSLLVLPKGGVPGSSKAVVVEQKTHAHAAARASSLSVQWGLRGPETGGYSI